MAINLDRSNRRVDEVHQTAHGAKGVDLHPHHEPIIRHVRDA
jgi:hypothetical protein